MKKKFLGLIMAGMVITVTGCKTAPEPSQEEPAVETVSADAIADETVSEDNAGDDETAPVSFDAALEIQDDDHNDDPEAIITPEDLLSSYRDSNDLSSGDVGYIMFDVDADGKEEMIFTLDGRIRDIYGSYNGNMQLTISASEDVDVTLYPEGMLKITQSATSEYNDVTWFQYYGELGDYLPVFQEVQGEYYTFCSYDLSKEDMDEINKGLESTGDYPVWLCEWFDMITKEEYDSIVPKSEPVILPAADDLSDMSALETRPEYILYVNSADGYADLRTGPGTEYEIICQMPNNDEVEVYLKDATPGNGEKWLKVAYYIVTDDEEGYAWLTGWVEESQVE